MSSDKLLSRLILLFTLWLLIGCSIFQRPAHSMPYTRVTVDTSRISDWDSFHTVFAEAFGFPDFYGRNLNAWVDCLSSLDSPEDGMTTVHAPRGGVLVLELPHARDLAVRFPTIYSELIQSSAFINHRRIEVGEDPVLCLSFF